MPLARPGMRPSTDCNQILKHICGTLLSFGMLGVGILCVIRYGHDWSYFACVLLIGPLICLVLTSSILVIIEFRQMLKYKFSRRDRSVLLNRSVLQGTSLPVNISNSLQQTEVIYSNNIFDLKLSSCSVI